MTQNLMGVTWPDCIVRGEIPPEMSKLDAVTHAHLAWGCCMGGSKPPEGFGNFMVELQRRFNVNAQPDKLPIAKDFQTQRSKS